MPSSVQQIQKYAEMAKDGNLVGLQGLYNHFFQPIFRFCYWQTQSTSDAEDITQETFLAVAKGIRNFRAESSVKNWIYQIAKHKISEWIRHKTKFAPNQELILETLIDSSNWIEPDNQLFKKRLVKDLLAKLSKKHQSILTLRYLRGYSIEETAGELSLSESQIKVYSHRAILKLRTLLATETM